MQLKLEVVVRRSFSLSERVMAGKNFAPCRSSDILYSSAARSRSGLCPCATLTQSFGTRDRWAMRRCNLKFFGLHNSGLLILFASS